MDHPLYVQAVEGAPGLWFGQDPVTGQLGLFVKKADGSDLGVVFLIHEGTIKRYFLNEEARALAGVYLDETGRIQVSE